jgi:hypothetical protein
MRGRRNQYYFEILDKNSYRRGENRETGKKAGQKKKRISQMLRRPSLLSVVIAPPSCKNVLVLRETAARADSNQE